MTKKIASKKPLPTLKAPHSTNEVKPLSVFDFQDYRAFLKAVLEERQKRIKGYTLAAMAKALGFSSHAGLAMIVNGKRELRPPYLDRLTKSLGFSVNERLYFEAMVRAGNLSESKRRSLLREVEFLSQTWEPPEETPGIRMLDYGLVHQILCLRRTYMTISEIRAHFRYPIEDKKILEILDFMAERNQVMTEYFANGKKFRIQKDVLVIKDEVPNSSGQQLHKDCLSLAANALDDPREFREFQSFIFTMARKDIGKMKAKIKEMVRQAISEFESDLDADTAVQLHFNMFEAIRPLEELKDESKDVQIPEEFL